MLDIIEKLLILQDRDQRIRRVKGELAHIEPERQAFNGKAASAQADLEKAKLRAKEIESSRKDLELEVEAKKQLIAKYANQQFQTRKNEEYRALAHEIEMCKEAIFKIEDREIELMEQAEAVQKEILRATQAAHETRKLVEEQVAQLGARERNLQKELAELSANREVLAAAVDPVHAPGTTPGAEQRGECRRRRGAGGLRRMPHAAAAAIAGDVPGGQGVGGVQQLRAHPLLHAGHGPGRGGLKGSRAQFAA